MFKPTHHCLTLAAVALSAFFVLPATGQTINEDLKLTASDAAAGDHFGISIDIDNNIVAVGAFLDDDNGNKSGSAYVFNTSTGTQLFKLLPSDGAAEDNFGISIALDDDVIAVGAWNDDDNGRNSGSVYLFDASTGTQLLKLLPNDGAAEDSFGISIAFDGGIVAVGARENDDNGQSSGSVYLFDASTGTQLFKLLPGDGEAFDYFGYSIAIDNGIVAVGAIWDDDNGLDSGSAYLFDTSTGTQLFKLLPSDGAQFDQFGNSIAIDNGIVAVGAYGDDDNGNFSGSAYLFDASTGSQLFKLLPIDAEPYDLFGRYIAIDNDVVAVVAPEDDDNGLKSGSAFLFDVSTGTQMAKILPSDGAADDRFGRSIAIDNGIIVVGTRDDDDHGSRSGSAYLFTVPNPCPADLNSDGTLNFFDISAFLSAFANNNPIADFTNDSIYDFFDVSAFLQAFAAGCP